MKGNFIKWGVGLFVLGFVLSKWVDVPNFGFDFDFDFDFDEFFNKTDEFSPTNSLMVDLTLIQRANATGAVCLDGSLPGYYIDRGSGSGENRWIIHLQGEGWCDSIQSCVDWKTTPYGSSNYMEQQTAFTGILSNKAEENPDFFNWNRVKVGYCDGASFLGNGEDEPAGLHFRGGRIWTAVMDELMSKGMDDADRALMSGGSAGGLAAIFYCEEFNDLFEPETHVKCLSDAGMFLDVNDVSGKRTLRSIYDGVVNLQRVKQNLPRTCTSRLDPTSCFFPENLVSDIKTPLFILNSAYDTWQLQNSWAPESADPNGEWSGCKKDDAECSPSQIEALQGYRDYMLNSLAKFETHGQTGLFIISCFLHSLSERQDTWFADDSPVIGDRRIAEAVGDWYFERSPVKEIDCPYPCDTTCPKTKSLAFHVKPGNFILHLLMFILVSEFTTYYLQ